ncbi:MAG TPA: baseplate J/gp47 family protein, partial [Acetobacteraceae bacterium]|nr:baseplate J/gp47 family protein [Acetobacteraceae bacterium]
ALRSRFAAFLNSRSRATPAAIGYAVSTVQQGLQYTIQENVTQTGFALPGSFVVTVDDGSGAPPAALLTAVGTAIEGVRPLGSLWTVVAPTVSQANIAMTITTAAGANHATVATNVAAAITQFVNALPVGAALPWSRIAQVAYDVSGSVSNVTGVTLNGGTADLVPGAGGVVKAGTVGVA